MDKCFHVATNWNTHYVLGVDDGEGNIPKEIKSMGSYYEISFTHGKFTVRVHGVAYAKFGDYEKIKKEQVEEKSEKLSLVN